ncbi:MAG: urate hydroxylase PuuD [Nitrospirae bacterium]|nr:urate hydroxylase PuuD [Nitrospirota bacterium]MBI3351334.1 urate hydroxylase PuuD [Nitrospirota bacterium]
MTTPTLELLMRWGHFLAGITWIGILYYFNFIQGAFLKAVTPETKAEAFKHLVPRALLWFRYSALATWLFGAAILGSRGILGDAFMLKGSSAIIGMGAWLGTIMFLNVWLIIWPNQKKVLGIVAAAAQEKTRAGRVAFLASRTNTMLSIPMLFFMGSSSHGASLFF